MIGAHDIEALTHPLFPNLLRHMASYRLLAAARSITLALMLVVAAAASAYAQNASETRNLDSFDRLFIKVPGDVELSQGDEQIVRIEADSEEVLQKIETRVRNGQLIIDGDREEDRRGLMDFLFGDDDDDGDLTFYITMTDVTELKVEGVGDVEGQTTISGDALTLEITGTGDIELDLEMNELTTTLTGTGDAELSGVADMHTIRVNGTGDVEAEDLITKRTDASVSGVGDCEVHATESLRATANGVGSIRYHGSPSDVRVQSSGIGSIEPAN